jgi:hypothetical protein
MNRQIILCLALVMSLLLTGCTTQSQSRIAGRWKVSGSDDVVTLTKDHSARLTCSGMTVTGSYQMVAPDLLVLTFPGGDPQSAERTVVYKVPLDNRAGRSLKVFTDTDPVAVARSQEELPSLVGRRVKVVGTAMHSCPGAMVDGEHGQVYIEHMQYWPAKYDHWLVQLTGSLAKHPTITGLYAVRDARWTPLGIAGSLGAAEIKELQRLMLNGRSPSNPSDARILYHNAEYDFTFTLPASWSDYSVLVQQWDGQSYLAATDKVVVTEHGPVIVLRHPQWTADGHYQDIPIQVFTRSQWEAHHLGKFSIGAGGFQDEIGHNSKYVFAISSRFNADDSVKGWKEAAEIVGENQAVIVPRLYPQ